MKNSKRSAWVILTVALLAAGFVVFVFVRDAVWVQAVAVLVFCVVVGVLLVPRLQRGDVAPGRFGDLARRLVALETAVYVVGGMVAVALFALSSGVKACCYSRQSLEAALEERFGPATASSQLPFSRVPAKSFVGQGAPTRVAQEVDKVWPSEDQRYTPMGVLLRYEHRIVAILPGEDATSHVFLADDGEAFRVFYEQLGPFWGPSYAERRGGVPSSRSVPDRSDLDRLATVLRSAAQAQKAANSDELPCYAWSIEVRSGRRAGQLDGSQDGTNRDVARKTCSDSFTLEGYLDPNAGRLRRGSQGDLSFGVSCFCVEAPDSRRLATPLVEVIEGATQTPRDSGVRRGKGLIEHIESLPLLAAEAGNLRFVEPTRPPSHAPTQLSPTTRSDTERRAERSGVGVIATLPAVAAGFLLAAMVVLAVSGAALKLAARARRNP